MHRLPPIASTTLAALLFLSSAAAQEQPDDVPVDAQATDDQRDDEPTRSEKVEQRNQQRTEEDGIQRFEDVTVERKRPEDLPPAESTEVPKVLRGGRLPSPPSVDQLKATVRRVRPAVFEVIAVQTPEAPGDATPIVHRGHAVFAQGPKKDGPPVLVSTYFWLSKAQKLYLVPRNLSDDDSDDSGDGEGAGDEDRDDDAMPRAERRSLEDVSVDGKAERWLEGRRDELVGADLFRPDEHRNLVVIVPDSIERLGLPERGLELFDLSQESPTRLYGYSPQAGDGLTQTRLSGGKQKHKALLYYLQTGYRAVFGAPIVSTSGKLLVLTAFRHPKKRKKDTTLVVPPTPLRNYLEEIQTLAE